MSARPLDLKALERAAPFVEPQDAGEAMLALVRYCRTARAALVECSKLERHEESHDNAWRSGCNHPACAALRDLDAIAGEP